MTMDKFDADAWNAQLADEIIAAIRAEQKAAGVHPEVEAELLAMPDEVYFVYSARKAAAVAAGTDADFRVVWPPRR